MRERAEEITCEHPGRPREEMAVIISCLRSTLDRLQAMGLNLSIHSDFEEFGKAWCALSGKDGPNSIFDPRESLLDSSNSFWLSLNDGGDTLATVATRQFLTQDLRAFFASGQMFASARPLLDMGYADAVSDTFPALSGRIAYQGGLYAAPSLRGSGTGLLLGRLCRLLSMRFFETDWHIADGVDSIAWSSLPLVKYGYSNIVPMFAEQWLQQNGARQLHLMWVTRTDLLARLVEHVVEDIGK